MTYERTSSRKHSVFWLMGTTVQLCLIHAATIGPCDPLLTESICVQRFYILGMSLVAQEVSTHHIRVKES